MEWEQFKQWVKEKYGNELEPIEDLIWRDAELKSGKKIFWDFVDTVDFDIDSIKKKRKIIAELEVGEEEWLKTIIE